MFIVMNNTLFIVFEEPTDTCSNVHDKRNSRFPIPEHLLVGGSSACLCKVYGTCSVLTCWHWFFFSLWESCDFRRYFPGSDMTFKGICWIHHQRCLWNYGFPWYKFGCSPLMAIFRCPGSVEKQPAYNRLLFNLVVLSVPQGRQWAKLNRDNPGCRRYTTRLSSQRDLVLGTCPDRRLEPVPCSSNWRRGSSPHATLLLLLIART